MCKIFGKRCVAMKCELMLGKRRRYYENTAGYVYTAKT